MRKLMARSVMPKNLPKTHLRWQDYRSATLKKGSLLKRVYSYYYFY